jgi:hypothetical protein
MTSYVLKDTATGEFLEKTDAWGHTLTNDIQRARIYVNLKAANRTATNTPAYARGALPQLTPVKIVIQLAE